MPAEQPEQADQDQIQGNDVVENGGTNRITIPAINAMSGAADW